VKLYTAILYLALLVSCNNTSTLQGGKQGESVKVTQSQILQTKMSPKQYEFFKKQIRNESELLKKIQTAELQFTYTTYHYMKGAATVITLYLDKNGTGHIQNNATNRYFEIKWKEEDSIISIAPTFSKDTIPFTKLKRIDRKTLLCQSENKKEEKRFYGKLNHENNLEILDLIEHMESNTSSGSHSTFYRKS